LPSLQLSNVWRFRELVYFLAWRDVKVRYKQTALGVSWVVLQPLITTVVFSLLFGGLLKVPSGSVPYPVFACAALVPWNYFAGSLGRASTSLVTNASLLTKVYFPRMVIPLSGVLASLVDATVAFCVLLALMIHYHVAIPPSALLLPLFMLQAIVTALGFSLWFSALNVRFRDVTYLIPFVIQIWMYVTPVIYATTLIPERWRFLLVLNPMTGVVEGFRWALLGIAPASLGQGPLAILVPGLVAVLVLISGAYYFRATERTFADIV
jgi:lipopolysaccharide transport system permease protein